MTSLEILTQARELILNPAHWTQRVTARSRTGQKVNSMSPAATCWCSFGAITRVASDQELSEEAMDYLDQAVAVVTGAKELNIISFNDDHTHAEVLAVWNKAVELAHEDQL